MSCDLCHQKKHLLQCTKCAQNYCLDCEPIVHKANIFEHDCYHICDECSDNKISEVYCTHCLTYMCDDCDKKYHNKGARLNEKRIKASKLERKPEHSSISIAPAPIIPANVDTTPSIANVAITSLAQPLSALPSQPTQSNITVPPQNNSNNNATTDLPGKGVVMHKNSAPFIPKTWKPFYPAYTQTSFHAQNLSGYTAPQQWNPPTQSDSSIYITPFQQLPICSDKRVNKLQTYLKILAQNGEIIIHRQLLIAQLFNTSEWENENIDDAINVGINESLLNINEVKHSKEKSISLISMKLKKISIECIYWVLKSLEKDEMTPTDRVIQSRIKESFSIKLQPVQWDEIIQVLSVSSTYINRNPL